MTTSANGVTELLPELCRSVLNGATIPSRNGATREKTHVTIKLHKPWQREVLTPGRKADIVAQIAETLWVLSGSNDAEWLSAYLPRALDFSDDGKTWRAGYGPRLRHWSESFDEEEPSYVDQLSAVIARLKANPDDRRAVMSLWDPAEDWVESKDVPCNNWLHFLIRDGALHLAVAVRSNDLMWGWSGINQFEWSALQEFVASILGVKVGPLVFHISSLHLYEQHWTKAQRLITSEPAEEAADSPRANVGSLAELDDQLHTCLMIEAQLRAGKRPGLNLNGAISDPLLRSWMQVLTWHWTKDEGWLESLKGTRLYLATEQRPSGKPSPAQQYATWAADLHADKHKVYGDSWKKRGEFVSIQANIARKIDRLGKAGAGDDEVDTATDLLVYLVKYDLWLRGMTTDGDVHERHVRANLGKLAKEHRTNTLDAAGQQQWLTDEFEKLLLAPGNTNTHRAARADIVKGMLYRAFSLGLYRWTEQQARLADLDAALTQAPTGLGAHAERNATRRWNADSQVMPTW